MGLTPYENDRSWAWLKKANREWPKEHKEWNESLHPRGEAGRFGNSRGASKPAPASTPARPSGADIALPHSYADIDRFIGEVKKSKEYREVEDRLAKCVSETRSGDCRKWSVEKNTDSRGEYTPARKALHDKIIAGILTPDTVAAPGTRKQAVFLLGAPGSGKTSAGQPMVDKLVKGKLATLNSDDIKSALPEYNGWNAGAMHHESTSVLEGPLMQRALTGNHNVLFDLTGNNAYGLLDMAKKMGKRGYDVHVVNVSVPEHVSVGRTWNRFLHSGRFVPPTYVKESDHKSQVTYDMLKDEPYVKSWASVDNTDKPVLIERGSR